MLTLRKKLPRDKIDRIKLYTPEGAGVRWEGCKHADLLAEVETQAKARGWSVSDPDVAVNSTKAWMSAVFRIRTGAKLARPESLTTCLGLFNTNDRRRALTAYTGVMDRKTGIGYVLGKSVNGTQHQKAYDFTQTVTVILNEWEASLGEMPKVIDKLAGYALKEGERCETLFRCCRGSIMDALPWRRLGQVDKFYLEAQDYTSWGLYTAVSRMLAKHAPMKQLDVMAKVVDNLPSL